MKVARIFLKPDGAKYIDHPIEDGCMGFHLHKIMQLDGALYAPGHVIPVESIFFAVILSNAPVNEGVQLTVPIVMGEKPN
jgi:hypothetical protein